MFDSIFRRVMAYVIDMILVSIVVSSIISSNVVNFQLDKYNKLYSEYMDVYNLYVEQIGNDIKTCEDLEKTIEDKKITEEQYIEEYEKLKDSYSKQEVSKEEYNDKCLAIVNDYNSNKMTDDEYVEKADYYFYHLEKNSIMAYLCNIVICLLYFVFFQGFTGGQTLGKKLNRVRVVSKDDNKVSYKQLFVRTIFLHSNIYYLLMLIAALIIPKSHFSDITNIFYLMNYILSIVLVFTISFSKGKGGFHDNVAKTKIIEVDFRGNEIKPKEVDKTLKKEDTLDNKKIKIKKNKNNKEKLD